MAQHTRKQTPAQNTEPETASSSVGGQIAQEALPVFQRLVTDMFDQVAQQAAQQAAHQSQAKITALADQQKALGNDVRILSQKLEQILEQLDKTKDHGPGKQLLHSILEALGIAEGHHRKATTQMREGTLTAESVEEFRGAMQAFGNNLNQALNRIARLEERADDTDQKLAGVAEGLGSHEEHLKDHEQRLGVLEQGSGNDHLRKIKALLGFTPGDEGTPPQSEVLTRIHDRLGGVETSQEATAKQVGRFGVTVFGVEPSAGKAGYNGVVKELQLDPVGASTRLRSIEDKLYAHQAQFAALQSGDNGIPPRTALAIGSALGALIFLLLIALSASFMPALILAVATFGVVTGVVMAIGKKPARRGKRTRLDLKL